MELFYNTREKQQRESILSYKDKSFTFLHHTGYMYGIGCKADDQTALKRISRLKGGSGRKGFIMLLPGITALSFTDGRTLISRGRRSFPSIKVLINQKALYLMEQYQPGNLTVCLEAIDAEEYRHVMYKGKIAFRVPENKGLRDFIKKINKPIISTSINKGGEEPLDSLQDIRELDWFDFALLSTGETEKKGVPSTIIEPAGDELICHREGSVPFEEIEESANKPLILFVCTGNICRSPLAEYYARHLFEKRKLPFRVSSAGFIPASVAISANSYSVLHKDGIFAGEHYSQSLNAKLVRRAWLILTMEKRHQEMLQKAFPSCKDRLFTLSSFCGAQGDVEDPFQQDIEKYRNTYQLIKQFVNVLADKMSLRHKRPITLRQLAKTEAESLAK